jgi:N-acetyltransferase 10
LSLLDFKSEKDQDIHNRDLSLYEFDLLFSEFDIRRLNSYSKNLVDYHVIIELVPIIAKLYFMKKLPFGISFIQAAILVGIGLQHHTLNDLNVFFLLFQYLD